MATPPPITDVADADDPRLASFAEVADPARLRREGRFVAEGRRLVLEALRRRPADVEAVLVTRAAWRALASAWPAGLEAPVLRVPGPAVLRTLTGHAFHQGALALLARGEDPPPQALLARPARAGRPLLVLEGVSDPDNVGTLLRSAEALGAGGALLGPGCAHPLYRKALRTSLGSALRLPWAVAGSWPAALVDVGAGGWLRVALTPAPDAEPLGEVAATLSARPVAVLLGSEAEGLSREALGAADRRVRIPMHGDADSINVAAAGAIALHALAHAARAPRRPAGGAAS